MEDHINVSLRTTPVLILSAILIFLIAFTTGYFVRDQIEKPKLVVPAGAQTNNGMAYCVPNVPTPATGCVQPTQP